MRIASLTLATGAALAFSGVSADAATITSSDFTFRFGSTIKAVANTWTQTENPGNSTPTIGNFTFSPAPSSRAQSGTGPKFPNGVLTNGAPTDDGDVDIVGSLSNPFGDPWSFSVPVTGSYNGPAPVDAAPTPNYRLILEITNISIYAAAGQAVNNSIAWQDQTPGHAETGSAVTLLTANSSNRNLAATYTLVPYDPTDYELSLGTLNSSVTRTFGFALPGGTFDNGQQGDGITVQGKVHLVYDAIPEPASMGIIALAGAALLGRRRM